jgi:glucuronate isomerase
MIKTAKAFLGEDFLLSNDTARQLYYDYAVGMPVIDFHNHLSPKDIAENRKFNNLTEAWLEGDHYKWRAMRTNSVPEQFCTGNAKPADKFLKWAETVPYTLRNPLYHWTHLELKNYFGVTQLLDKTTAHEIYQTCSMQLQQDDFSVQQLLSRMNVEVVCTTDDPADSLEHHEKFASAKNKFRMFPTFRPDKAYAFEDPKTYLKYLEKLGAASDMHIGSFDALTVALKKRIEYFHSLGCRASDHGLERIYFDIDAEKNAEHNFRRIISGKTLDMAERKQLKSAVLICLGRIYHEKGWVQQFHLGAMRNNNSRIMREVGPDSGFDSIGDYSQAESLSRFLDHLDNTNQLAKTILYNLNPADNELFATMAGNFNDGSIAGKIQYGSGWWFLDQKDGMRKQLNALSNMGLIARFVGMVTDSRSFLSFPRHEYFRRILCNIFGKDIENGELPDDLQHIGSIIKAICCENARAYFNFPQR